MLGLALGGGTLRGAAHIGVLQALEEAGIRPDVVTGTSVGSLVGSFFAAGMSSAQLLQLTATLEQGVLFDAEFSRLGLLLAAPRFTMDLLGRKRWRSAPNGLAAGVRLERWLAAHLPVERFEDLELPFAAVACDLRSARTVAIAAHDGPVCQPPPGVLFLEGVSVAAAVRASCAIPWFYTPRRLAGRLLVDGGVVEPVPAGIARLMGAQVVLAVDLGTGTPRQQEVQGLVRIVERSAAIALQRLTDLQLYLYADVVVRPDLSGLDTADLSEMGECVERGRQAMQASLPALCRALGLEGAAAAPPPQPPSQPQRLAAPPAATALCPPTSMA